MLRVLDGMHAEAGVHHRVTADIDSDTPAGRLMGSHIEFLDDAAEALSSARRLGDEGHLNEWCDEASLERAAGAEGR